MVPKNEENGHFSKLKYMAGGYLESTRYLKSQPLETRKKGFGTKDAFKVRSIKANTCRPSVQLYAFASMIYTHTSIDAFIHASFRRAAAY